MKVFELMGNNFKGYSFSGKSDTTPEISTNGVRDSTWGIQLDGYR